MRPIASLSVTEASSLAGLCLDLDDTLLSHGALTEAAYGALHRLRAMGLGLVVTTGRPASWGEVLAATWPVDAVVTEHGAVAFHREGRRVLRRDAVEPEERARRRRDLAEGVAAVRARWPELAPSDDADGRTSDFTFDVGEHRTVEPATVAAASGFARERGLRAFASSVHLHLTLDGDDKASGTVRALGAAYGFDPAVALVRFAFIGDSENDASCFAAFRTTIAVANFRGRPSVAPRYRTSRAMGEGFAEAAAVIVARRAGHPA